jgi:hypothetical protein
MTHTDVSDSHDLDVGERAFRTAKGVMAFVTVVAKPHELPGCYAFTVSARAVDDNLSPILDHHCRPVTAGPHEVTVQTDLDEDVGTVLDRNRALLLDRLDRAVSNTRAIADLAGVKIN